MKRYLIKYILVALAVVNVSCESFFEPDNDAIVFDDDKYNSVTDINAAIVGVYRQMQSIAEPIVLLGELRADMMTVSDSAPQELKQINDLDLTADNPYLSRRPFFDIINSCDDILAKMDAVANSDPKYTPEVRRDFKAEVLGVRAWTYWQLCQIFGSVTYNKESLNTLQLAQKLSVELNALRGDFRESVYSADWTRARMNKWAMAALCGELDMVLGNFAAAAANFESIMQASGDNMFKLTGTYSGENWKNIFLSFTNAQQELIWGIDFNANYKQNNDLQKFASSYLKIVEQSVAPLFKDENVRMKNTYSNKQILKYSIAMLQPTPVSEYVNATPIIIYRAADIHLRYSECLNHLGRHAMALKIINVGDVENYAQTKGVRGRAGRGAINDKLEIAASDSLVVIDKLILDERARELAFEGKRWYDILRFNAYHVSENILRACMEKKSVSVAEMLEDEQKFYVNF